MKKRGFTLAEVLITLSVIGIVAAIVIPSLMNNISDKVWDAKSKALYARMSNAIASFDKLNGYGKYEITTNEDGTKTTTDTAAETFLLDGLSKAYKIKRVCGTENIEKCGFNYTYTDTTRTANKSFPTKLTDLYSVSYATNFQNTGAAAFETQNGERILTFYNPFCSISPSNASSINIPRTMCVNFIYDLNGAKAPNQVGKDIGMMTAFYGSGSYPELAMPLVMMNDEQGFNASVRKTYSDALSYCENKNENYTLPNIWELASININNKLSGFAGSGQYWSSTPYSAGAEGRAWAQLIGHESGLYKNGIEPRAKNQTYGVYCVKKNND